ncbi:MAG: PaaI family thioesterase [bacterium]|nr:PaaI family thioesterase [bacterium]
MTRIEELEQGFGEHPFSRLLGAKLERLETGFAVVSAKVTHEMLITQGMVQGGVSFSIADFAGVYAAMSRISAGHTPLANVHGDYYGPFRIDEVILARADVVAIDKKSLHVIVEVFCGSEKRAHFTLRFAKPKE